MTRCPAHGNRIQRPPQERSTCLARPLNQIVVGHQRLSHRHDRDIAGQRAPLDHDYLTRIEQAIAQAKVVLLVGHGKGQRNMAEVLKNHLRQHQPHLLERVRAITVNDTSLSDDALLALARQQFGNLPLPSSSRT